MKQFILYAFIGFLCSVSVAEAQNVREIIDAYDKPAKMNYYSAEQAKEENAPIMHHYQATPAPSAVEGKPEEGKAQNLYMRDPSEAIIPVAEPDEDEKEKEFSYKSTGVVLEGAERFPPLKDLTEWPWLRELTYEPSNPATINAMDIMDRDLSKAPPLAMIWGAQHYYDTKQYDKALFFYLASRLRSSVDQARFTRHVPKADLSASTKNIETDRMTGAHSNGDYNDEARYKSLSAYNNVAASIGKPILKYGLKHPAAYKKQLDAAMQWDFETPYEYKPSVSDLVVDEAQREKWQKSYEDVRNLYHKQMNKIIEAVSK